MNKFLLSNSTGGGLSESEVKKMIDDSAVVYNSDNTVSIFDGNNALLYTLPTTDCPTGYVLASSPTDSKRLIFTNQPGSVPSLTNPLTSDLICAGYNIIGAGVVRPNTLEVAGSSLLPIINGNSQFNGILSCDNINSVGAVLNLNNDTKIADTKTLSAQYMVCSSSMKVNTLLPTSGPTGIINLTGNMNVSNYVQSSTIMTNSLGTPSSGDTLNLTAPIASGFNVACGSLSTNTIGTRSGTTLALTAQTTTANAITVSGTSTSNNLITNTITARSATDVKCNSHLTIATDKVLSTNEIVNLNNITMTPTTLRPQPVISGCSLISTDSALSINSMMSVDIDSSIIRLNGDRVTVRGELVLFNGIMSSTTADLKINNNTDFTNKTLKNINAFQSCPPITDITTRLSALESTQTNIPVLSNILPNANGNIMSTSSPNYVFKTLSYGEGIKFDISNSTIMISNTTLPLINSVGVRVNALESEQKLSITNNGLVNTLITGAYPLYYVKGLIAGNGITITSGDRDMTISCNVVAQSIYENTLTGLMNNIFGCTIQNTPTYTFYRIGRMVSLTISAFSITPTAIRPSITLLSMDGSFADVVPPVAITDQIDVLVGTVWRLARITVSSTSINMVDITSNTSYAANVNISNNGITLCYKV